MSLRLTLIILTLACFALPLCADAIHSDSELDAAILQANQYYMDANFDEGIKLLKTMEASRPESPAVSYFIANGYWWKIFRVYVYEKNASNTPFEKDFNSNLDEAVRRSQLLLDKNPNDLLGLFYMGNSYSLKSRVKGLQGSYFSASRDAAKGKKCLEDVVHIDKDQYDTFYNLGVYNYLAGALPGYAKFLKIFLFLPGGSKDKGLTMLDTASKKSSYFSDEAKLLLARFYADYEERPADAVKIVDDYRHKYPNNAWFQFWSGALYSDEMNDYATAQRIYEEILAECNRGAPGFTEEVKNQTWLKLARVYSRQLDPERAIDEIHKLIATNPKNPQWILAKAYLELGNDYDVIGMRKEALASYEKVLSLKDYRDYHDQATKLMSSSYNQKLADIYRMNLEGRKLAALGRFEEANLSFKKVLEKYPGNDQTQLAIAEMDYLKGSYKEATDLLNGLATRHPKDPKWLLPAVYVKLGQVYQASAQQAAARRSYEKALATDSIASDDRNQAKRALRAIGES